MKARTYMILNIYLQKRILYKFLFKKSWEGIIFYKKTSFKMYLETVRLLKKYLTIRNLYEDNEKNFILLKNNSLTDEFISMVKEEILITDNIISNYHKNLLNENSIKFKRSGNLILEIRAGVGGLEANAFVNLLYKMYSKYILSLNLKYTVLSYSNCSNGLIKQVYLKVEGGSMLKKFIFESGVHRIQRVPDTETNGRIHTSTATVAILPEINEGELQIDEKDLRINVCRSSGPGGQGVNTTDSTVQILHKPSGILISCSNQRTQIKNKLIALTILRSKLSEMQERKNNNDYLTQRNIQIGTASRSEKIRTYNFSTNTVIDHRFKVSSMNLQDIINGNLNYLVDKIIHL